MNNKISNRTYESLKNLFLNCRESQDEAKKFGLHENSALAYAKEFCTIKMCCSRRSGHSTAIAKLINEYPDYWAIIDYNLNCSKRTLERIARCDLENLETNNPLKITNYTQHKIDFGEYSFILLLILYS